MSAQDDEEYAPSDAGDEGVEEAASNAAEEAVQESAESVTDSTSPSSTANSASRKRSAGPVTTARASNKKKKQQQKKKARKGVGSRVKINRNKLFHLLQGEHIDAQQAVLEKLDGDHLLYGTIISGTSNKLYNVRFDAFPAGQQEVKVRSTNLEVVEPGTEEPTHDHVDLTADADADAMTDDFLSLPESVLAIATTYRHQYGKGDDEKIDWQILRDDEHVTDLPFNPSPDVQYKKNIDWSEDMDFNQVFFDDFFPSIVGHAAIIDDYLSDPRCKCRSTVAAQSIKFHDPDADDPDWRVRVCYTLMIAAASEIEVGVDNLWKRGPSGGRHEFPHFGQYMPVNYFKCFRAAAPFCWCDKKHWYAAKADTPWDVFLPCVADFNDKRQQLLKAVLVVLDESMSGWRPKTSKLGGLPNYTWEPRKPVPLGTMFRNGVECISGILVHQDVVQLPELQASKEFHDEPSHLPGCPEIPAHVAEVLRQIKGAGLPRGEGWVGGDSWFGSIMSAVEAKIRFGVDSTWIIKNNHLFFPLKQLFAVLKARYGDHPAGHWVIFRATISGIKLFAMAFAWSQKGVSYIVSTCGSTEPHPTKYVSRFEDEWGCPSSKEINRPWISHMLYEFLPLIDEHNKQRQSLLNLERCWPTTNCWFRLLTTLMGMSVVDMHRWDRNQRSKRPQRQHRRSDDDDDNTDIEALKVRKFSDLICGYLNNIERRNITPRRIQGRPSGNPNDDLLERIEDCQGNTTRPQAPSQAKKGRATGNAIVRNCFICRKYLNEGRKTNYQQTQWRCKSCKMPLCKADRVEDQPTGRELSCVDEHFDSEEPQLMCIGVEKMWGSFPRALQVSLHPRRSGRLSI